MTELSANIYWEMVAPVDAREVNTATPSNTITCLTKAFGSMPITLNTNCLGILSGLDIAGIQGIKDLIVAIEEYGPIRVWVES